MYIFYLATPYRYTKTIRMVYIDDSKNVSVRRYKFHFIK